MCYAEYRGFFHIGMITRNERNAIIQHGTMTLVRRAALDHVGGWAEWCITEDAELGLRLFEHGHEALYLPRSYGRGLMPETFGDYKKQRFRWAYGAMQILRRAQRRAFLLARPAPYAGTTLSLRRGLVAVGGRRPQPHLHARSTRVVDRDDRRTASDRSAADHVFGITGVPVHVQAREARAPLRLAPRSQPAPNVRRGRCRPRAVAHHRRRDPQSVRSRATSRSIRTPKTNQAHAVSRRTRRRCAPGKPAMLLAILAAAYGLTHEIALTTASDGRNSERAQGAGPFGVGRRGAHPGDSLRGGIARLAGQLIALPARWLGPLPTHLPAALAQPEQ